MKGIVFIWLLVFFVGCGERRPLANTPEHKAAHGHIEGQSNELWVGKTLLHFPAGMRYNPVTPGKIIKGRAHSITFGLSYPALYPGEIQNGILITVRGGGYEVPEIWDKHLEEEVWTEIIDKPELGLREYHRKRYNGAWGYITYLAMDDKDRTPKGSLIRFRCAGHPIGEVDECLSGFVLEEDLYVEYKILKPLFPHWRKIHNDVVELVNGLIVK